MDRHKLPGEDARQAQRRLYLESVGKAECRLCGRVGSRGFVADETAEGRTDALHRCHSPIACGRRSRRTQEDAHTRLRRVREAIMFYRFSYATEDDLQHGIASAIAQDWAVVREHTLKGRQRIDLYLPALRVGIETKVDGNPGDVLGQCLRYLEHPDIDALLLVTCRARHQLPAELATKPVAVLHMEATWL